jgi:hypothetical protein
MLTSFLETTEQDFALVNGQLSLISDARAIAQGVENNFRFFLGEWFLNTLEGIPYFQKVFLKNPDVNLIRQLFRRAILKSAGVQDVTAFSMQYDSSQRTLIYSFSALTETGETISGGSAFILDQGT